MKNLNILPKNQQPISRLLSTSFATLCLLLLSSNMKNVQASDHIDGTISIKNAVADITDLYAFPNPNKAGHLVLIANVHLAVARTGHFSERIHYDFLLRPAVINHNIVPALFQVGKEVRISCQFETPTQAHAPHWVTCYGSHGNSVRTQVDDTQSKVSDSGLQIFAGRRADPFFFNTNWALETAEQGVIPEPVESSKNGMKHLNILSLVLDIDLAKYFAKPPTLMALAFETLTQDSDNKTNPKALRRIDWVGRPEITNISMVAHGEEEDLRDRYNQEIPFDTTSPNRALYRERLRKNIDYYDALDKKQDWSTTMADHYADLLVNDYLVIDMSKPCGEDTYKRYFSIEKAMLNGDTQQNCGGRHPNDDVIDSLFTRFINADKGIRIRDGIDKPSTEIAQTFPYLSAPDDSLWAALKAWLIRLLITF